MRDGWHKICGYDVYIESDRVIRGTIEKYQGISTVYPYRLNKYGCVNCSGLTVAAFRAAVRRGSVIMA